MRVCLYSLVGLSLAVASICLVEAAPADTKPTIDKAEHKTYTEKIPGTSVEFEMVAVPGGTFMMGSPESEKGRKPDEGPQHPVKINPLWMGKCEVTWDEFDAFWKRPDNFKPVTDADKLADAVSRPTPPYADETFGHGREGQPVLCISHHTAMQYCNWLSAKTGKYYRLPTEAEWEYACRAGTTTAYSWGDDPTKADDYAWYKKNSEDVTHLVGKKKPNPFGLYDMHGNVGEWCVDHYLKDSYSKFPLDKATLGPVSLPTENRWSHVARGGAWSDNPEALRSAVRRGSNKDWIKRDPQLPQSIWWLTDAEFVGFRVVRAVTEQENLKNLKSKVTKESD